VLEAASSKASGSFFNATLAFCPKSHKAPVSVHQENLSKNGLEKCPWRHPKMEKGNVASAGNPLNHFRVASSSNRDNSGIPWRNFHPIIIYFSDFQ
jgi:hypothetical protein